MTVTVYSTKSCSTAYHLYYDKKNDRELNRISKTITINGGANIIDKNLHTPFGIVTQVEDGDFEILQNNSVFKKHVENGFITFEKGKKKNVDKAVKNMKNKDKSSQKVKEDFEKAPTSNAVVDE